MAATAAGLRFLLSKNRQMDRVSYLIISNVVTGFVLVMTCGVALFRIRIVRCPFCNGRIRQEELRAHIELCNEHNTLYMGRFSPSLMPLPPQPQHPQHPQHPQEQLAVAVPLPSPYVIHPTYTGATKYADI